MDMEAVRANERVKAVAGMCDNASLALFISTVARGFANPDLYVVLDFLIGVVLLWMAWHIRGLLQPED